MSQIVRRLRFLAYSYNFEQDYIRNTVRILFAVILSLGGLGLALRVFLFNLHWGFYGAAAFILLMGFLVFIIGDDGLMNRKHLYYVNINPTVLRSVDTSGPYGDYDVINFNNNYFLYSSNVNYLLNEKRIDVRWHPEKFQLNEDLRKLAPFVLQEYPEIPENRLFRKQINLRTDITLGSLMNNREVVLGLSDYFSGVCSNEIILKEIWSRKNNQAIFNGLHLLTNRNLLIGFEHSACANIIGINSLLFTNDGKIAIFKQDKPYAENINQLIPSLSTTLEDKAYIPGHSLQEIICTEVNDEISKTFKIPLNKTATILTGYTRLLNRGGKPEFFSITRTTENLADLNPKKNIYPNTMQVTLFQNSSKELSGMLRQILETEEDYFSVHLYLNIYMLLKQVEKGNPYILRFLGMK